MIPALTHRLLTHRLLKHRLLKAIWAWLNVLLPFGKPVHGKESLSDYSKCCAPVPDGCTGVPDFDFGDVCNRHDLDYAAGGTSADRRRADEALRQGILDRGHPILARIYFIGVRVLGKRAFCFHEGGLSVCDAYHAEALSDYTDNISGRAPKSGNTFRKLLRLKSTVIPSLKVSD